MFSLRVQILMLTLLNPCLACRMITVELMISWFVPAVIVVKRESAVKTARLTHSQRVPPRSGPSRRGVEPAVGPTDPDNVLTVAAAVQRSRRPREPPTSIHLA